MTSISDTSSYQEVCQGFVINDELFKEFKQNSVYTSILEHTSKEQALQYIRYIEGSKLDFSKIGKLKENDEQGTPAILSYGDAYFNGISPSTIRYIKVLSEIVDIFTHLNGKDVVEIGVGYGGQCKILNDYFNIKSYQLVDLPVVQDLSKKYLGRYSYQNLDFSHNYRDSYDFVISNYAITECNKKVQLNYIHNIVNKSKHGYITCNYISDLFNIDSLTKDEFIKAINKEVFIQPEYPLTHSNNFLMIW